MAVLRPQEQRVLSHVSRGQAQKQVAASMNLSQHTVKNYLRNARKRTGLTTIELAVKLSIEQAQQQ
jgi:DNA-binding CsgD family transcriptional regulator